MHAMWRCPASGGEGGGEEREKWSAARRPTSPGHYIEMSVIFPPCLLRSGAQRRSFLPSWLRAKFFPLPCPKVERTKQSHLYILVLRVSFLHHPCWGNEMELGRNGAAGSSSFPQSSRIKCTHRWSLAQQKKFTARQTRLPAQKQCSNQNSQGAPPTKTVQRRQLIRKGLNMGMEKGRLLQ